MRQRTIDHMRDDEDWEGNNAAVTCPACGKVFIVSELIHPGETHMSKMRQVYGHDPGRKKNRRDGHNHLA
jgi:hypothetical protein